MLFEGIGKRTSSSAEIENIEVFSSKFKQLDSVSFKCFFHSHFRIM